MKKLMFVIASFALISSAMAADGTETKFSGEIRGRYWMMGNPTMAANGETDTFWTQRTKLGATFSKGEDLMGQVTMMANSVWGDGTLGGTVNGAPSQDTGGDMWVYEAWGFWKAMDNMSLRIGRGALQIADGSVIGLNEWEEQPKVFEGVLGTWYSEFANIHAFGVKGLDTLATDEPEANFYGLSVDVKNLPEAIKMANIHLLQVNKHFVPDTFMGQLSSGSVLRYGLTVGGGMMNIDYKATYAGYSGELKSGTTTNDQSGSMLDLEAGYTFEDFMKWRIGANYHMDSGDDTTTANENEGYDPFHYNSHEAAGLMDIVEWGNSTYIKIGTSFQPWENSVVGLDYYMFSLSEETGAPNIGGMWTAPAAAATPSDDLGTEIDVYAHKTYANGFSAGLRYGVFTPGDYFVSTAESGSQFMLEGKFSF